MGLLSQSAAWMELERDNLTPREYTCYRLGILDYVLNIVVPQLNRNGFTVDDAALIHLLREEQTYRLSHLSETAMKGVAVGDCEVVSLDDWEEAQLEIEEALDHRAEQFTQ